MAKRFKNGLVLGKFMPPHLGHLYLIDTAASQCEKLYVMICSDETQPIAGALRYKWLRVMYDSTNEIEIIWCQDKNPQYPNECDSVDEFYTKYWVPSVYSRIKKLDVVFTSEEYGDEFASYLGIQHVSVDQARLFAPISGTDVRLDPYKNWRYIPSVVRQYFQKKVVLMGPESVGKSILTQRLAIHYDTAYVPEYGREHAKELVKKGNAWTLNDFDKIARTQAHHVKYQSHFARKVLFVDTEAITTKVFAEMYLGADNPCNFIFLENEINEQAFDLYLLLDVDVPWVDDGTRVFPEGRKEHFNRLKQELDERKLPYVVISGNYQERFEKAVEEVDKLGYLY